MSSTRRSNATIPTGYSSSISHLSSYCDELDAIALSYLLAGAKETERKIEELYKKGEAFSCNYGSLTSCLPPVITRPSSTEPVVAHLEDQLRSTLEDLKEKVYAAIKEKGYWPSGDEADPLIRMSILATAGKHLCALIHKAYFMGPAAPVQVRRAEPAAHLQALLLAANEYDQEVWQGAGCDAKADQEILIRAVLMEWEFWAEASIPYPSIETQGQP